MTGVLYAIARFCVRRRFVVFAVWLLTAVALLGVSHRLSDNTSDNLSLPGTDSQRATDALSHSFPLSPTALTRSCCMSRAAS